MASKLDFQVFEGSYREAAALAIWLETDVKLSSDDAKGIVDEEWDWGSICHMSQADVNQLVKNGRLKKGPSRKLLAQLKKLEHCSAGSRDEL
jgi:hypothetical protein